MEIAAFVVSLVALLWAGIALVYTHRADRRAGRAERRAEQEAVARLRAKPVAIERGGRGGRRAETTDYSYEVRNAGQGTLTELWLWHQTPGGKSVSTKAGGRMVLAAGEAAKSHLSVTTRQPYAEEQEVWFEWVDDDGRHVEFSGITRSPDS